MGVMPCARSRFALGGTDETLTILVYPTLGSEVWGWESPSSSPGCPYCSPCLPHAAWCLQPRCAVRSSHRRGKDGRCAQLSRGAFAPFEPEVCTCLCPPQHPTSLGSSMQVSRLEPSVQAQIREVDPQLQTVYFNKGL